MMVINKATSVELAEVFVLVHFLQNEIAISAGGIETRRTCVGRFTLPRARFTWASPFGTRCAGNVACEKKDGEKSHIQERRGGQWGDTLLWDLKEQKWRELIEAQKKSNGIFKTGLLGRFPHEMLAEPKTCSPEPESELLRVLQRRDARCEAVSTS
jgi:hypothetical protein